MKIIQDFALKQTTVQISFHDHIRVQLTEFGKRTLKKNSSYIGVQGNNYAYMTLEELVQIFTSEDLDECVEGFEIEVEKGWKH